MYAYIQGTLIEYSAPKVVIENNNIGYELLIPLSSANHLPEKGKLVKFFTVFIVREDAHTLYGFLSQNEKQLFETLLGINGVGPKLALSIISHLKAEDLASAIIKQDIPFLSKIPGVGKKTAERLIMELKDKVSLFFHSPTSYQIKADLPEGAMKDAISALTRLGFASSQAHKAVKKTLDESNAPLELSELITLTLKNLN